MAEVSAIRSNHRQDSPLIQYLRQFPMEGLEKDYIEGHHASRYLLEFDLIRRLGGSGRLAVLSIGVGYGHLELLLEKFCGFHLSGVDRIDRLNGEARKKIRFERVDLTQEPLPFQDRSFDLALASEVLEHLSGGYEHVLGEMNRVMKDGATLILSTPNFACLDNIITLIRGKNPLSWGMHPDSMSVWGEGQRHIYEFTEQECVGMLKAVGFRIEQIIYPLLMDIRKRRTLCNGDTQKIFYKKIFNSLFFLLLRWRKRWRRHMILVATRQSCSL